MKVVKLEVKKYRKLRKVLRKDGSIREDVWMQRTIYLPRDFEESDSVVVMDLEAFKEVIKGNLEVLRGVEL